MAVEGRWNDPIAAQCYRAIPLAQLTVPTVSSQSLHYRTVYRDIWQRVHRLRHLQSTRRAQLPPAQLVRLRLPGVQPQCSGQYSQCRAHELDARHHTVQAYVFPSGNRDDNQTII